MFNTVKDRLITYFTQYPIPHHLCSKGMHVLTRSRLKPLKNFENMVDFIKMSHEEANDGDECIIGLDVGSTTTKAIIFRVKDKKILASSYLRTNGNPVKASRECYSYLLKAIKVMR